MNLNRHLDLAGKHAFLSPSQHSWLRYDKSKLITSYNNSLAKEKGTEDHEFAALCIRRKQRIHKTDNPNLANYVNDAIGFRMEPEVTLAYSDFCFGTADALSYRRNELRIHDLKTGVSPVSMEQLEIYAALFCLEYRVNPESIFIELRIYQFGEIEIYHPEGARIREVMDIIIRDDEILSSYIAEVNNNGD